MSGLLWGGLLGGVLTLAPPAASDGLRVTATPIPLHLMDPTRDRVGSLEYLGGLALRSEDPRFGGLSGILVSDDGRQLVAISDMGDWFELSLGYDSGGRLVAASGAASGRLRDTGGVPLGSKREADAEGLGRLPDGSMLVGFEMGHRLWRYAGEPPLAAAAEVFEGPEGLASAPHNLGIEALVACADDRVLLLGEGIEAGPGLLRGWIGAPGAWQELSYRRHGDPRPTAATRLPDGDVLVLERGFKPSEGNEIRLRRIAAASIEGGAVLDGPAVAELRPLLNVDNFEGLDARVDADGRTILYLISDDNFSRRQRTLLMMFAMDGAPPAP